MQNQFSYLVLKHLYSKVVIYVFFLTSAIIIGGLFSSFFFTKEESSRLRKPVIIAQKKIKLHPAYHVLPLQHQYNTLFEQDIERDIRFFGKNSRPDASKQSIEGLVGFDSSDQRSFLAQNKKHYLKYTNGKLEFSEKTTPIWLVISSLSDDILELQLNFLLAHSSNSEVFQHTKTLKVAKSFSEEESLCKDIEKTSWYEQFSKVKWWGGDKFYDTYGALSKNYKIGSQRLDFKGDGADFLFVNSGDTLIYKENMWQKPQDQEETTSYPLAFVKEATPLKMQIAIYDKSGIFSKNVQLFPEKFQPLKVNIEETFTKFRQKSLEKITCKLGKKTIILKEGDWVLKTESGWKVLKDYEDIEKYLNLITKGELFVFDKIEKTTDAGNVLKGRLFDPMRSQVQTIRIPLSTGKKNNGLHSKKKPNFSKMNHSSHKAFEDEKLLESLEQDELLSYE